MSDPIHSSNWTGGEPTYSAGTSSVPSDYERILRAQRELETTPPELHRLQRRAALLLLSPLALWVSYWITHAVIRDAFGQDCSGALALSTLVAILAASLQSTSRSRNLIGLKRAALSVALGTSVGGACLYSYAAITSYAQAIPSIAERTFEIYRCHGRCRFGGYFVHQRADGTTVEGEYVGRPLAYGTTCTTVQRLRGDYGFSWVRVLERSPPPAHEIAWPIRREDCFSDKPVATLRR
jgi:hypothetical protein